MRVVYSKNNIPVRITDGRLEHIFNGHPEMNNMQDDIIATLERPDVIQNGDYGEKLACKLFDKSPVTFNKYLVAVYKEETTEGFLITAYFTRKLSDRREVLWML
ncbi:MAG: DUF4258 domain-containing protein [Candidatus Delongbacteria bacterium]|nr:DUF4258 domain-containing protein [Candidatus Delongbacteria bacterium]